MHNLLLWTTVDLVERSGFISRWRVLQVYIFLLERPRELHMNTLAFADTVLIKQRSCPVQQLVLHILDMGLPPIHHRWKRRCASRVACPSLLLSHQQVNVLVLHLLLGFYDSLNAFLLKYAEADFK